MMQVPAPDAIPESPRCGAEQGAAGQRSTGQPSTGRRSTGQRAPGWRRWLRRSAWVLGSLGAVGLGVHLAIPRVCKLQPPALAPPRGQPSVETSADGTVRRFDGSSVRRVGSVLEVHLAGQPAQIGRAHSTLLYDEMVLNERVLWQLFTQNVTHGWARALLLDLAQVGYRHVDREMSAARLAEITTGARAFQPDPFADPFDTFQRFLYLNALYDIALSFEHSPLIGCTSMVLAKGAEPGRGSLLARAFDFEVHEIFDQRKAVFLVRERGKLPFASVAWPGLVGVVSGMNLAGLAAVVHGARAGEPRSQGEPVVHAVRRILSEASTTEQAVALFAEREPMVSHLVVMADARGSAVAIERVPGRPQHVRRLGPRAAVSNHLEGPSAGDPKNQRVRAVTSSLARRARADELVRAVQQEPSVADAVALLRDRRGPGGAALPLGDRRAIDALIATHGVVMDTEARVLWVSEAPHLLGAFIGFDLRGLLADDYDPARDDGVRPRLDPDPLLRSGAYARWRAEHQRTGDARR